VSQKPAHVYIDYSFVIDLPILIAKFVSKHWWPNNCFSSAHKQHDCSLHYFVRS